MTVRYSKRVISKSITREDGSVAMYHAHTMGAKHVAKEGYKLMMAIAPSIGAGIDDLSAKDDILATGGENTIAATLHMLSANMSDEHFEDLSSKLMGSLMCGDLKIDGDHEHFDEYIEDYLDILIWLFKENFTNFILGSGTIMSLVNKARKVLTPKLTEMLEKLGRDPEEELNEK